MAAVKSFYDWHFLRLWNNLAPPTRGTIKRLIKKIIVMCTNASPMAVGRIRCLWLWTAPFFNYKGGGLKDSVVQHWCTIPLYMKKRESEIQWLSVGFSGNNCKIVFISTSLNNQTHFFLEELHGYRVEPDWETTDWFGQAISGILGFSPLFSLSLSLPTLTVWISGDCLICFISLALSSFAQLLPNSGHFSQVPSTLLQLHLPFMFPLRIPFADPLRQLPPSFLIVVAGFCF